MDLPVISRRTRFTASREHVRGYDAFRLNGSHVFSSKERERERETYLSSDLGTETLKRLFLTKEIRYDLIGRWTTRSASGFKCNTLRVTFLERVTFRAQ